MPETLASLSRQAILIPCTSRSWGEMLEQDYPGKGVLTETAYGIYESGLVVKKRDEVVLLCEESRLVQIEKIKELVQADFIPRGRRAKESKYELTEGLDDRWAFGYLGSMLGEETISKQCVPLIFPPFSNQYSLVIWPSGTFRECPPGRFFYQVCVYLDGLKRGRPELFDGVSILIGDEAVLIRPNKPDGVAIQKIDGIKALVEENIIQPETSLLIVDDDRTDLTAANYLQKNGGTILVPENAGSQLRAMADAVLPGTAGYAAAPIFESLIQEKL
ncbi:hypothetical protein HY214_02870 [Candidatus Roizmanbacteria bacterium]|nr:hypothetical protein [Candidatus Roizmanbacteria bacterium]